MPTESADDSIASPRGLKRQRARGDGGFKQHGVELVAGNAEHRLRQGSRGGSPVHPVDAGVMHPDGACGVQDGKQPQTGEHIDAKGAQAFAADLVAGEAMLLDKRDGPPAGQA